MLERIALGTESRVAQTGAAVRTLGTVTEAIAKTVIRTGTAVTPVRRTSIATAFTAITELATATGRCQLGALLARAVVAAHSHHRAGRCFDGRCRHNHFRGCGLGIGICTGHGLIGGLGSFSSWDSGFDRRCFSLLLWRAHFGAGLRSSSLRGGHRRAGSSLFSRHSHGLTAQSSVQTLHGRANFLCIAAGVGSFQGARSVKHRAVMRADLRGHLLTLHRLAVESLINRLTERLPQLLLELALQRHGLRFGLPALLQDLDRVDAQARRCAQDFGFGNQGVAAFDAGFLRRFQRRCRLVNDFFPLRLQFGKRLFAQVACIAPAVAKLVQRAQLQLPVGVVDMGLAPGAQLLHHGQALTTVLDGFVFQLVQPLLHHLVGFVASRVKTLPQGMVGHAALVGELPLVAQLAQGFLHLAPTHGGDLGRCGFGCSSRWGRGRGLRHSLGFRGSFCNRLRWSF